MGLTERWGTTGPGRGSHSKPQGWGARGGRGRGRGRGRGPRHFFAAAVPFHEPKHVDKPRAPPPPASSLGSSFDAEVDFLVEDLLRDDDGDDDDDSVSRPSVVADDNEAADSILAEDDQVLPHATPAQHRTLPRASSGPHSSDAVAATQKQTRWQIPASASPEPKTAAGSREAVDPNTEQTDLRAPDVVSRDGSDERATERTDRDSDSLSAERPSEGELIDIAMGPHVQWRSQDLEVPAFFRGVEHCMSTTFTQYGSNRLFFLKCTSLFAARIPLSNAVEAIVADSKIKSSASDSAPPPSRWLLPGVSDRAGTKSDTLTAARNRIASAANALSSESSHLAGSVQGFTNKSSHPAHHMPVLAADGTPTAPLLLDTVPHARPALWPDTPLRQRSRKDRVALIAIKKDRLKRSPLWVPQVGRIEKPVDAVMRYQGSGADPETARVLEEAVKRSASSEVLHRNTHAFSAVEGIDAAVCTTPVEDKFVQSSRGWFTMEDMRPLLSTHRLPEAVPREMFFALRKYATSADAALEFSLPSAESPTDKAKSSPSGVKTGDDGAENMSKQMRRKQAQARNYEESMKNSRVGYQHLRRTFVAGVMPRVANGYLVDVDSMQMLPGSDVFTVGNATVAGWAENENRGPAAPIPGGIPTKAAVAAMTEKPYTHGVHLESELGLKDEVDALYDAGVALETEVRASKRMSEHFRVIDFCDAVSYLDDPRSRSFTFAHMARPADEKHYPLIRRPRTDAAVAAAQPGDAVPQDAITDACLPRQSKKNAMFDESAFFTPQVIRALGEGVADQETTFYEFRNAVSNNFMAAQMLLPQVPIVQRSHGIGLIEAAADLARALKQRGETERCASLQVAAAKLREVLIATELVDDAMVRKQFEPRLKRDARGDPRRRRHLNCSLESAVGRFASYRQRWKTNVEAEIENAQAAADGKTSRWFQPDGPESTALGEAEVKAAAEATVDEAHPKLYSSLQNGIVGFSMVTVDEVAIEDITLRFHDSTDYEVNVATGKYTTLPGPLAISVSRTSVGVFNGRTSAEEAAAIARTVASLLETMRRRAPALHHAMADPSWTIDRLRTDGPFFITARPGADRSSAPEDNSTVAVHSSDGNQDEVGSIRDIRDGEGKSKAPASARQQKLAAALSSTTDAARSDHHGWIPPSTLLQHPVLAVAAPTTAAYHRTFGTHGFGAIEGIPAAQMAKLRITGSGSPHDLLQDTAKEVLGATGIDHRRLPWQLVPDARAAGTESGGGGAQKSEAALDPFERSVPFDLSPSIMDVLSLPLVNESDRRRLPPLPPGHKLPAVLYRCLRAISVETAVLQAHPPTWGCLRAGRHNGALGPMLYRVVYCPTLAERAHLLARLPALVTGEQRIAPLTDDAGMVFIPQRASLHHIMTSARTLGPAPAHAAYYDALPNHRFWFRPRSGLSMRRALQETRSAYDNHDTGSLLADDIYVRPGRARTLERFITDRAHYIRAYPQCPLLDGDARRSVVGDIPSLGSPLFDAAGRLRSRVTVDSAGLNAVRHGPSAELSAFAAGAGDAAALESIAPGEWLFSSRGLVATMPSPRRPLIPLINTSAKTLSLLSLRSAI